MIGDIRTCDRWAAFVRAVDIAAATLLVATSLSFGQDTPPPADIPRAENAPPAPPSPASSHGYAKESAPAAGSSISDHSERLLQEVDGISERLAAAGDKATAESLRAEAAKIRSQGATSFALPKADPYLVHAVYLSEAGPPPPGFGTGQDRFTMRYAEVQVGSLPQPAVLVLASSVKKMHWHVKKHESTRLLAVVVDSADNADVSGLDESTAIVGVNNGDGSSEPGSWPDPDADDQDGYRSMRSRWSALAGATVLTLSGLSTKPGTPIVVAPDQPEFRSQITARQAKALHRRATNAIVAPEQSIPGDLANHKFRGIHYLVYQGGQYASAGTAEFTLRGPRADSLQHRYGKLTNFIEDTKENLHFALNGNVLGLLGEGVGEFESIPFDANETPLANLLSLTLDTTRRRIVAATDAKSLYEYDLKLAAWAKLEETEYPLSSVCYVPEIDGFFAFSSDSSDRRDERRPRVPLRPAPGEAELPKLSGLRMLKLSSTGKVVKVVRDDITLDEWPGSARHHTQVAYSDGKIALFGGCRDDSSGAVAAPVLLLDAETGKTLYSGRMAPWTNAPPIKRTNSIASSGPRSSHRTGKLVRDLFAIESGIELLRKQGRNERADRAAKQLARIRSIMHGGGTWPAGGSQVHLVGCYEHKNVEVRVSETVRPIALVLSSYAAGTWKLTLADGAKIERVIVGGYHKQQINGLPEGVPVDYFVAEQGSKDYFITYDETSSSHAKAMTIIRGLIGTAPATMQGRYRLRDEVIEIGPRSLEWRLQQVLPLN